RGYVAANRAALQEMLRQVGPNLTLDEQGVGQRGMIVRHMILPNGLSQTAAVLAWIASALSSKVHVSLMSQYFPAHRALTHPDLNRKINAAELEAALAALDNAGLENGWLQEPFEDGDHEPVSGWERARHSAA
ncbi:MAG: hypothetical protein ACUVWR_15640, partial [Anaerolineae bacterium]